MQNQHVLSFDAVQNDVLTHGKAMQARTQLFVTASSGAWVVCKQEKTPPCLSKKRRDKGRAPAFSGEKTAWP